MEEYWYTEDVNGWEKEEWTRNMWQYTQVREDGLPGLGCAEQRGRIWDTILKDT